MRKHLSHYIFTLLLVLASLPASGQDFLNIYFSDGTFKIFHFDGFESLYVNKIDAEGVAHDDDMFQHVMSSGKEYVYNLTDIDSIAFTKIDEEKAASNMASALTAILPALKDCESIGEVSEKLDDVKHAEGVETAWISGEYLFIKIRDWETITMGYHPRFKGNIDGETNQLTEQLQQAVPSPQRVNNRDGVKLSVAIANSQHYEGSGWRQFQRDEMYKLKQSFDDAGFDCKYIAEPDLDFFGNSIYTYDVVFLSAHGGYNPTDGHFLETGQIFGAYSKNAILSTLNSQQTYIMCKNLMKSYYDEFLINNPSYSADDLIFDFSEEERLNDGVLEDYYVARLYIKESFFDNDSPKFNNPHSLFFNCACVSLKGGTADENDEGEDFSLANILLDKRGLGTYLGYTNSNIFGQITGCYFLNDVLTGISSEKAYNTLDTITIHVENHYGLGGIVFDEWYNKFLNIYYDKIEGTYKDEEITESNWWGLNITKHYFARLKMLPDGKKCFITPVYTRELSHDEVMNDYNLNHSVEVMAETTTIDPSKITMGFKYGTSRNNLNKSVPADFSEEIIDNGRGNYQMATALKDLEPGNTYYYCAYTYDGLHYNYGDTLSFTIDAPVVTNGASVKSILLTKAEYRPNGYDFNGVKHDFRYTVSATAAITGATAPVEWGFDVMGPDGQTIARHRASDTNTSNPWPFYVIADGPSTTLKVRAYAIWQQGEQATTGEWQTFDLLYSTDISLQMTGVTFNGTTQNVQYNGQTYKYKSSFRFEYNVGGAYWQTVGLLEEGSGWSNWQQPQRFVRPADGANATTINYYYNDRTFAGEYLVRLQSTDTTHNTGLRTTSYVEYLHNGTMFTGCTYHSGLAAPATQQAPAVAGPVFENGEINIIISSTN